MEDGKCWKQSGSGWERSLCLRAEGEELEGVMDAGGNRSVSGLELVERETVRVTGSGMRRNYRAQTRTPGSGNES